MDISNMIQFLRAGVQLVGVKVVSDTTGLSRQTIYNCLNGKHDPAFSKIVAITEAIGLRVTVIGVDHEKE